MIIVLAYVVVFSSGYWSYFCSCASPEAGFGWVGLCFPFMSRKYTSLVCLLFLVCLYIYIYIWFLRLGNTLIQEQTQRKGIVIFCLIEYFFSCPPFQPKRHKKWYFLSDFEIFLAYYICFVDNFVVLYFDSLYKLIY